MTRKEARAKRVHDAIGALLLSDFDKLSWSEWDHMRTARRVAAQLMSPASDKPKAGK